MLLRIEPLRNELKSLESEAGVSEAKVSHIYSQLRNTKATPKKTALKIVYFCTYTQFTTIEILKFRT